MVYKLKILLYSRGPTTKCGSRFGFVSLHLEIEITQYKEVCGGGCPPPHLASRQWGRA
jgi:hypothetical protein